MICPYCQLYISNPDAEMCPRCGQPQFDLPDRAQGYEQRPEPTYRPTAPASRPSSGALSGYDSQPYGDHSYSGQAHQPGYGSQRFQPTFSAPATPRWTPPMAPELAPPARKTSTARRVLLFGGLSAGLLILALILCVGGLYFIGLQASHNHQGLATMTPFPGTTPGATILFQDPLTSATAGWTNDNHCFFQDNAYHIKDGYACYAPAGNIGDATITAQVEQIAGTPGVGYGIAFRRTSTGNFYEFEIASNSEWRFAKYVNGTFSEITSPAASTAIKGGLNTINTLSVTAKGSDFEFFVNGTLVGQATDSTFSTGLAGLLVGNNGVEVAFNNFQITAAS